MQHNEYNLYYQKNQKNHEVFISLTVDTVTNPTKKLFSSHMHHCIREDVNVIENMNADNGVMLCFFLSYFFS